MKLRILPGITWPSVTRHMSTKDEVVISKALGRGERIQIERVIDAILYGIFSTRRS
jgi:hypothetical protein